MRTCAYYWSAFKTGLFLAARHIMLTAVQEETKESLKKKRKSRPESVPEKKEESTSTKPVKPSRKRVSFG